jgi:hypothetical protein
MREHMISNKNEPSNNQNHDEESLNTILKLNFKNSKNFKIDQSSKLDTIASNKLYNSNHELEVKVDFLEKELYNTENKMNKKIQY